MMEIIGKVDKIIFSNEDSGYTIFALETEDHTEVIVKGIFYKIKLNEKIKVVGEWVVDKSYGKQIQMQHYESVMPANMEQLEEYLASGVFPGIKKALAKRIVERFGAETLTVLKDEPLRLVEVKGIGKDSAKKIGKAMHELTDVKEMILFLSNYGIAPRLGNKIMKKFQDQTYEILQKNPYRLTEIEGVGFKTADKIALDNNIPPKSEFRVQSGIQYVMDYEFRCGHTCFYKDKLIQITAKELSVDTDTVITNVNEMLLTKKLIQDNMYDKEVLYNPEIFYKERYIANKFKELSSVKYKYENVKLEDNTLDETQLSAVRMAAENGVMVLTGGPGCGKTTTTKMIIEYFEELKMKVNLAAPTGRAAKRMQESTGRFSQTIHRLLQYEHGEFVYNRDNLLECDVLIIDEVSMLDFMLFYALVSAVPNNCHLIFVGDKNQLPSVGAGNVLSDIISSKVCLVCELTKIYRQAEGSDIVSNAHHILKGEKLEFHNKDFFIKEVETQEDIKKTVLRYATESLPEFTGEKNIQILTPLRVREIGTNTLNELMREKINPGGELNHGFRVGDKVIQTKNNYELERIDKNGRRQLGGFNGDMGVIEKIDEDEQYFYIRYDDGTLAQYDYEDVDQLELSYALTVHKSQGSEYPVVVIPLYDYIPTLTTMNLLYTAITRAKKCVVIVGNRKSIVKILNNRTISCRCTGLAERLR